MKLGIIGFHGSGKTTLFNLLTGMSGAVSRPTARGQLNIGVARVPDERLRQLAGIFRPERTVHATIEIADLAGFERGERAGLDLVDLRNADVLLHVVRAFPFPVLAAPPDPARDVQSLEEELVLADLEIAERRLDKLGPGLRRKPTESEQREEALLGRLRPRLAEGVALRTETLASDEARLLRGYQFLSRKPILHCLNVGEGDVGRRAELLATLDAVRSCPEVAIGWISAALENEVAALPEGEQRAFLDALGLPEPTRHRVIRDAYALLGLVSFFTAGEDEVRAWTIPAGTPALQAAAAVHSDIARGFIRAEVIGWRELLEAGSLAEARRRGLLRLEGKDYVVKDGEVFRVRFNVRP